MGGKDILQPVHVLYHTECTEWNFEDLARYNQSDGFLSNHMFGMGCRCSGTLAKDDPHNKGYKRQGE